MGFDSGIRNTHLGQYVGQLAELQDFHTGQGYQLKDDDGKKEEG